MVVRRINGRYTSVALKARTNRRGRSSVSGVKSLLWLLSAVSEVKTVEQQKKNLKKFVLATVQDIVYYSCI